MVVYGDSLHQEHSSGVLKTQEIISVFFSPKNNALAKKIIVSDPEMVKPTAKRSRLIGCERFTTPANGTNVQQLDNCLLYSLFISFSSYSLSNPNSHLTY